MSVGNNEVKLIIDGDASGATQAIDATGRGLRGLGESAVGAASAADGIDGIGEAAGRAATKSNEASNDIQSGLRSIGSQLTELKALYAAWIGVQQAAGAVKGIADTADAYNNLSAKIKLAVGDGEAFKIAFQGVQDVALRTNSSLESTGVLFTKLAEAGKQMGVGQQEALRLTETVNQAIQLSGSSAQASDAAITQLVQGLQGGVLRGDEFNSVMEQSPRLAKALADGLGVTTGELRKMAEAGQLSSQTVIEALQGQARTIEGEFTQLPATIGRAITNLESQWQLFIGTMDESSGASAAAANAIELLAENFDFVASSLINAGQAYLGWKAYNMAAEFLGIKAAVAESAAAKSVDTQATVANTAATAANTTAVAANTVATVANNAAKGVAGTAAKTADTAATVANTAAATANAAATAASGAASALAAGRIAGAIRLLRGLTVAGFLMNIVDIGKWLGEAAAKAMGYEKALKDAEMQMKANENAGRAMAAMDAEIAQKMKLAADEALGLSAGARKLVTDFDELIVKGDTTAEALSKIGKDFDLTNIGGIEEAGAALDALAVRGKISGDQVREAWANALNGKDLAVFEVQARAAFDNSEKGVRRLAAALDAQLSEALRRTGLDAGELSNGINKAAQSAINDFDILVERVDELGRRGADTGVALSASLDQATKAATTEAALNEIIRRWGELGEAGLVTGDRLAEGLEKARRKLDEIKPGVNSLEEAFRTLGMKSPAELRKVADSAEDAYLAIKRGSDGSKQSVAAVQQAFIAYAKAAIAANGGVVSDALRVEAAMADVEIKTDSAGKTVVRSMDEARNAVRGLNDDINRVNDGFEEMSDSAGRVRVQNGGGSGGGSSGGSRKSGLNIDGEVLRLGLDKETTAKVSELASFYVDQAIASGRIKSDGRSITNGITEAIRKAAAEVRNQEIAAGQNGQSDSRSAHEAAVAAAMQSVAQPAAQTTTPTSQQSTTHTVNINLGSAREAAINVASATDAKVLVDMLKKLEAEAGRAF